MKILVTGSRGQLARSLIHRAQGQRDIEIDTVGRPDLDLMDPTSVAREISTRRPDFVVSAAAYTAVDQAEDEPEIAMAINADGAEAVALAAAAINVPVIHLSSDYVFAGGGSEPSDEEDVPSPQSVYGRTKLAGERAVAAANPHHIILRTAWLYSPFGRNFLKTMLALAEQRKQIHVVSDQWGNPTSALDLADGILHIIGEMDNIPEPKRYGVFHVAGTGSTNWSGFADHIFAASRAAGGPWADVRSIVTSEYPTKAKRPANSRLSTDKLDRVYGWRAPDWRISCAEVVHHLVQETVPT